MPKNRERARASNRRQRAKLNDAARSINAAYIAQHARKCPTCGARVLLPCRECGVEEAKRAGAVKEADDEPADDCEYMPTPDELKAGMARARAEHLAYKLAQPYKPELREGNPREIEPAWEGVDDETDNCA